MAIQDDKKTETPDEVADEASNAALVRAESKAIVENDEKETAGEGGEPDADASEDEGESPVQFGYRRFVYAAYFAAAIVIAFVAQKTLHFAWLSLAKWKPDFGEPTDEYIMPVAAVVGVLVAVYYWRSARTRELAEDVASELAKVTWPTKKEVANNTMIVIFTTTFATVFFTLMDRFWSFVTNWVYGT